MRSGYPDGASARCRTLNEFVIISYFIAKHGNEVAKRYVDHRDIETCRLLKNSKSIVKKLERSLYQMRKWKNIGKNVKTSSIYTNLHSKSLMAGLRMH